VTKSALVLLEEQVPCSGVNLHEIAVFCALNLTLFYKIPDHGLHLLCLSELKAMNSPEKPFLECIQN